MKNIRKIMIRGSTLLSNTEASRTLRVWYWMPIESSLAILFLVLIAISRALIFLFPKQARDIISKKLVKWPRSNFMVLAILMFIISILVFYSVLSSLTLAQLIAVIFGFAFLMGAGMLWHNEFYIAIMGVFSKKDDSWIRIHAGAAVIIALILLIYILKF